MITKELSRIECAAIASGLNVAVRCGEAAMRIAPDEANDEKFMQCQLMVETLAALFRRVESATITVS